MHLDFLVVAVVVVVVVVAVPYRATSLGIPWVVGGHLYACIQFTNYRTSTRALELKMEVAGAVNPQILLLA